MFAKNEKNPNATTSVPEPTPPEPKAPPSKISDMPSVISADLEVLGDLKSAGDIQVEGRVKGDIRSRSVSVMKGAVIEGSLYADTVNSSGVVNGEVEAPQVSVVFLWLVSFQQHDHSFNVAFRPCPQRFVHVGVVGGPYDRSILDRGRAPFRVERG